MDYIIWTGDIVPHDFKQTDQSVSHVLKEISKIFRKYFSRLKIYSSLGNHDTNPTNLMAPPEIKPNTKWLYDLTKQLWTPFIKDPQVKFSLAGYYSTQISPGFRLVSLNMVFCYVFNW